MPLDRQLVPVKLQYLFLSGASGSLLPYIPLYFKWLGLTATQSAIIIGGMPFSAAIFNPLVGALSDKMKCIKTLIILCAILSAAGHIGVRLIPLGFKDLNSTTTDMEFNAVHLMKYSESLNTTHQVSIPLLTHDGGGKHSGVLTELFLLLLAAEVLSYGVSEPISSLTDALTFTILGPNRRGDYGKQHILAAVGYPILSSLVGILIDVTAKQADSLTLFMYSPVFASYSFFMLCICFNTCTISTTHPGQTAESDNSSFGLGLCRIITNFELLVHFFITILYGILCGVSIAFLTWYLHSIGASHTVIGTSCIAFCVIELPVLYFAGKIMDKLGMINTMYLTFLIYIARYMGYSFMKVAWLVYVIEPLHGATSALMFTVTSAYAVSKIPESLTATATGLTFGSQLLGRGLGSVIGGVVYDSYGPQLLFWGCAVLSGVGMAILAISRLIVITCIRSDAGQVDITEDSGDPKDPAEAQVDNVQENAGQAGDIEDIAPTVVDNVHVNADIDAHLDQCDGEEDTGNIQDDINAGEDEPLISPS